MLESVHRDKTLALQILDQRVFPSVTLGRTDERFSRQGKARGKGGFGNWYAFRDMSVDTYRGVRLYAPKCRNGRHSIVYSDDNAKTPAAPPEPKPEETSAP